MAAKKLRADASEFGELALALLAAGNQISFRAAGNSMHPQIRNGDIVRVCPADPQKIRRGDIVLYRPQAGRGLLLHRVAGIKTINGCRNFIIRGDAALYHTDTVPADAVCGIAVGLERNGVKKHLRSSLTNVTVRLHRLRRKLRVLRHALRRCSSTVD